MLSVEMLLFLFLSHLIGDFFLQTEEMARKKSKDIVVLAWHVSTYILPFLFGMFFNTVIAPENKRIGTDAWFVFLVSNILLHFATDFFTSRLSSKKWEQGKTTEFFHVIGIDQTIHYITLVLTARFILC